LETDKKIVISGGAGLVGQNLVVALTAHGYSRVTVLDKSQRNLAVLSRLHPGVEAIEADLACAGEWQARVADADVVVILHAQIGGLDEREFEKNNVQATRNLLDAVRGKPDCHLLHVSSSVVNSAADDFYTRSKEVQENMVKSAEQPWFILRPTLMFGWFDRKHLGWLSRFMRRVPVFPIPGNGQFLRQPLFVRDFCDILLSCIASGDRGDAVNISGKEKVTYIDLVRKIRISVGSRTVLLRIPVWLFALLLNTYALFDRNPPFTEKQLRALIIDELFEDIDWEQRFGVRATPLDEALELTFNDPVYSDVVLEF
jgi:nucleoside-diphosphate-sugar epimerase